MKMSNKYKYLFQSDCAGLTELPENLKVKYDMILDGNTSLTALPEHLTVERNLNLRGCTGITSLPDSLRVGGTI